MSWLELRSAEPILITSSIDGLNETARVINLAKSLNSPTSLSSLQHILVYINGDGSYHTDRRWLAVSSISFSCAGCRKNMNICAYIMPHAPSVRRLNQAFSFRVRRNSARDFAGPDSVIDEYVRAQVQTKTHLFSGAFLA
jgi:hypothetical protein